MTFSVANGPATISGNIVTLTGAGGIGNIPRLVLGSAATISGTGFSDGFFSAQSFPLPQSLGDEMYIDQVLNNRFKVESKIGEGG